MTVSQRETAELLRSLDRPAELIAINAGIDMDAVQHWLKTGKWPSPRQGRLFDPTGLSPRLSTTKPTVTTLGNSGLSLFARFAD